MMAVRHERDLNIYEVRKNFIAGSDVSGKVKQEVLSSWKKAQNAGVKPDMKTMPELKDVRNKALNRKWLYRKALMRPYLERLIKLLDKNNTVLFWVHKNQTILYAFGNQKLLDELKRINICEGCCLKNDLIGTTSISLAVESGEAVSVIGSEHYQEILSRYVTTAVPFEDSIENSIYGYSLSVTTIDNYNPYLKELMFFYSQLAKTKVDYELESDSFQALDELSKISLHPDDKGVILVNQQGVILNANSWCINNINKEIPNKRMKGKFLKEIFPEMERLLDGLKTGEYLNFEEITIVDRDGKIKSFYIECLPLRKNSEILGLEINIYNSKKMYEVVNKISNNSAVFEFGDLIGASEKFNKAKTVAYQAARGNSNILITGESGTGKELFAQAIHNSSNRAFEPFTSINCAAIPTELISSELFGYVEGAFTGASKGGRTGKFEIANNGTLFLDEIGEMPLDMQSVLLRVLEEHKIVRVGGNMEIPVDVRVIAATNRNLLEAIEKKEFRADLYYRLKVMHVKLPSLRDRKSDIPDLVDYHVRQMNVSMGKEVEGVDDEVKALLMRYDWPGNIRELRNVIEYGINLCNGRMITINETPEELIAFDGIHTEATEEHPVINTESDLYFSQVKHSRLVTAEEIVDLMNKYNGNKSKVAKELNITRTTLYKKLKLAGYIE